MARIHATALVDPKAELADDVEVGPYAVVGPQVRIGAGTRIGAHCVIRDATIADGAVIHPFTHIDGEKLGARVGEGALVGPFARLRPGAHTLKAEVRYNKSSDSAPTTRTGRDEQDSHERSARSSSNRYCASAFTRPATSPFWQWACPWSSPTPCCSRSRSSTPATACAPRARPRWPS